MKNLFDRAKLFFSKDKEFRAALYNIMGFYPHNIELYRTAFAHKSLEYRSKKTGNKPLNNERLEFLGDAVLETVVSDIVYRHFPNKREGFLTNTRSKIVSRESLGRLAKDLGIDRLIQSQTHSRAHNSYIGGNSFEALMGAIYLDRGFAYAFRFVEKRIIGAALDLEGVAQKEVNFKSKLLEWGQKNRIRLDFKESHVGGNNSNQPSFLTTIVIEGVYAGEGKGFSKKESHQAASKDALTRLRREPHFLDSVFRAKEKRTAMTADECFVLPKIDEIEAELANPRAKGEKQERPKRERGERSEKQDRNARNEQKAERNERAEKPERNEKQDRKNNARAEKQDAAKGEQKPKPEQKPKAENKPEVKPERKAEPKAEQKSEPKAEQRPAKEMRQKPERNESKAEQKPERNEQRSEQRPERNEPKAERVEATSVAEKGGAEKTAPVEVAVEAAATPSAPAEAAPQAAVLGLLAQLAQAAPTETASSPEVKPAERAERPAQPQVATTKAPASKEELIIVEDIQSEADALAQEAVAEPLQAEIEVIEPEAPAVEIPTLTEEKMVAKVVAEEMAVEAMPEAAEAVDSFEDVEEAEADADESTEASAAEASSNEDKPKKKKGRRKGKRQSATEFTNTTPLPAEQSHRAEKAERRVREDKERRALEKARQDLEPETLEESEAPAADRTEQNEGRRERRERNERNERRRNNNNNNRRKNARNNADTEPTAEEIKQREALIAAAEAAAYDEL